MGLTILSPLDNGKIAELELTDWKSLDNDINETANFFAQLSNRIDKEKRISILEKLTLILEKKKDKIIQLAISEGGKPYKDTVIEFNRAINGIKIAIASIYKLAGSETPMNLNASSKNRIAFTSFEPIGIVAAISAFNHPINLIVHQAVTAISAGCPVFVKPDLRTPLSCIEIINSLHEAGLPKEFAKVVIANNEVAEKLACDSRIAYLSFIGSEKIGWYLRSKISAGTKVALEHGGAAPVILEQDADLKKAIPSIIKGAMYHSGQVCVSVQRLFVQKNILNRTIEMLKNECSNLKLIDPKDKESDLGPIIDSNSLMRISNWVNDAIKEGAKLICGGEIYQNTFFLPTVLLEPSLESEISKKEVFGPILCVYQYEKLEDAISFANALPYSFQSSIFTSSINSAINTALKFDANTVLINDHSAFRVDWMPFGGSSLSGLGTGGIEQSIKDMSKEKQIIINHS